MSELVLPGYLAVEQQVKRTAVAETAKELNKEDQIAKQLPVPCGFKILVGLPKIEDKYASGILKADAIVRQDEVATVIGFILKMGPDCYKDEARFPSGPFCKEGDFVLLRAYSGTRFKLHDVEFRLINDDAVECVIEDPRGFSRV